MKSALLSAGAEGVDLFECSFGFRNCLGDTGNDLVRVTRWVRTTVCVVAPVCIVSDEGVWD